MVRHYGPYGNLNFTVTGIALLLVPGESYRQPDPQPQGVQQQHHKNDNNNDHFLSCTAWLWFIWFLVRLDPSFEQQTVKQYNVIYFQLFLCFLSWMSKAHCISSRQRLSSIATDCVNLEPHDSWHLNKPTYLSAFMKGGHVKGGVVLLYCTARQCSLLRRKLMGCL